MNEFQDQLCLLLASLHEQQRLQVQYFCDSDYKSELLRYQRETEQFSNVWTKRARNERFSRYWQAMTERKLRRQRVILYISRALENVPKSFQTAASRREYYATLLDQLQTEYDHIHQLLLEIFGSNGARILPMSDIDHFRHLPGFSILPSTTVLITTRPRGSRPSFPFRKTAGTAKAAAKAISDFSSMAIIIRSSS